MHKYLPSKKFIYTVISVSLALIIIFITKSLLNSQIDKSGQVQSQKTTLEDRQKSEIKRILEIDSDDDGLKDWEEILWKTDPQKIDSDDDGTNDGEEVKNNRDPLKKAPGDEIDTKIIAENKKIDEEFSKLSDTDKLARVFFSQYVASKSSGSLGTTDKQIILDTAVSSLIETNDDAYKIYSISDIKLIRSANKEDLKDYGDKFTVGAQNMTGKTITQELSVVATAILDENESELKNLQPAIELYDTIINNYLNLEVPVEIANLHLNILNNLVSVRYSVEKMKFIFSDPIKAIAGLKEYKDSAVKLGENYNKMREYFQLNSVVFLPSDPGYKLFNVVK